jgi:predicted PurR-regulated permease PerM
MPKKKSSQGISFRSLRILGERAQLLLSKAKAISKRTQERSVSRMHSSSAPEQVSVHLSLLSAVESAFVILIIGVGVFLLYILRDTIVLLLLSLFIAILVDPGTKLLKRIGIPRGLAVILQYCIALILLIFLLVSLVPILSDQLKQLSIFINERLNDFLATPTIDLPFIGRDTNLHLTFLVQTLLQNLSIQRLTDALQQFSQNLSLAAEGSLLFAARMAGSVLSFFINLMIVLVIAFFMQMEKERTIAWVRSFLATRMRSYVDDRSELVHWKLAQWARGQLLLNFSVALLVFLALTILRMPYALTLAFLAGCTEFIPVIGIFIAAIPAVLIAITGQGFLWGLMLILVYYVIQWCEGNLLVPFIMRRTVGLSPIAIILAMLIGTSFPGVIHPVLGIVLAIPSATVIAIFLEDWREHRHRAR